MLLSLSATNKSILFLSSSSSRNKVISRVAATGPAVSLFSTSTSDSSPLLLRHRHRHYRTTTAATNALFSSSLHALATATASTTTNNKRRTMSTTISSDNYQAWRVEEQEDGSFIGNEKTLSIADTLAKKDDEDEENNENETVLIKVTHSSLNYKDALSSSGKKGGVTRNFPHTPGIDAAGYIVSGNNDVYKGQSVLVTGYDLGMNTNGGYGEYIRVPQKWIVTPNPFEIFDDDCDSSVSSSSPNADTANRISMIYGTSGLTAALSVEKLLINGHAKPADGKVLVTGSTGSVGSVAVELLSNLGFDVVAISGKVEDDKKKDFLIKLGANDVLGREVLETNKRPLLKPLYAHAIDTVGGAPLVEILKQIKNGGSVTCCGNAAGMQLDNLTVLPFILRGINLLGIDSVQISLKEKVHIWNKLATKWKCAKVEDSVIDIGRNELDTYLKLMLNGQSSGKIVLDHSLTKTTTTKTNVKSKL